MSWLDEIACPECDGEGETSCPCCDSGPFECGLCHGTGLDPKQFDIEAWLAATKPLGARCGLYEAGERVGTKTLDGRTEIRVERFRLIRATERPIGEILEEFGWIDRLLGERRRAASDQGVEDGG